MPHTQLIPFTTRDLKRIQNIALKAAVEAGKIQVKNFRRKIRVDEKKDAGLVTEVDLKSEELILKRLRKAYDFPIIGEESGRSGRIGDNIPTWHVDPLDGTTNYAHGFPMYGVSIGLAVGNEPVVGVVHAPSLKETWWAAKGLGAFHNNKPIQVSKRVKMQECLLATGFAYMKGAPLKLAIERFRHVSLKSRAVRRPGAAALDLAYLAMGVYDGFWERDLHSWDICAGSILVREAGGRISNFEDGPLELAAQEILGSNGVIHEQMVAILRAGLAAFERD